MLTAHTAFKYELVSATFTRDFPLLNVAMNH